MDLCTIGHSLPLHLALRRRRQDRKLPAGPGPIQHLAADGGIIDQGRDLDVGIGALARLIGGGEAPGIGLAVLGQGEGMIATGRDEDDVFVREGGDRGRDFEDAGVVALVEDDVGVGVEGVERDAHLVAVDAAPGETGAVGGDGDGVVHAAFEADDVLVRERGDERGFQDDGVVFARAFRDPRFAVVVEAPAPDAAGLVDGEGVVGPGFDVGDFAAGQAEFARHEAVHAGAFDDASAELVLLAGAPGEDVAFLVEREDVVAAADEVGDFLEGREVHGCSLDVRLCGEAEDAFVALGYGVSVPS